MRRRASVALLATCLASAALAAGPSFDFMPDGGRTLFAEVFGNAETAVATLAQSRDLAGWSSVIAEAAPQLDAKSQRTLAGYLTANLPAQALPPDGRDLALSRCQACHSLFSGYFMQRRDKMGWLSVFKSPFHQGIAMTPAELETFADYSALNMPLRLDQVPPELRF